MKKVVREPTSPLYQYFCDITGEQISEQAYYNSYSRSLESKICPVIGCTIMFNTSYGAILDGLSPEDEPLEVHLSEDVAKEMLNWMREKYPESSLIKNLTNHGFFEKFKM